jgi:predicted secreted protein
MSPVLAVALYFVIWWLVLFAVLPIGVKSQYEAGEVVPGSEGGAPHAPMLLRKAVITTLIAGVVFGIVHLFVVERIVSLDQIPIGPTFKQL